MKEVNNEEQERTMKKLIFANKQLREDLSREIERYNLLEEKFRGLLVKYNLAQEENEKNCDFECPTKGKILITIFTPVLSPHCPLLTRWEFRRPLHLPAVLPVCRLQAREELLSLRPVLGRHQEVLHLQERGGVWTSGEHPPAPHHHPSPRHGGEVQADRVQPALVLLLL